MSRIAVDLEAYPFEALAFASKTSDERNATVVRILKERPPGTPFEFTVHPHFRFEDTPVDRARRELGFPINT